MKPFPGEPQFDPPPPDDDPMGFMRLVLILVLNNVMCGLIGYLIRFMTA